MFSVSPPVAEPLRVFSLFSGIGGFEQGLSRAGHVIVGMCESDPAARSVLEFHFPGIQIEPDITKMATLPDCELLTAGWPCQNLSLAGGMLGLAGAQSGLISEVFRLIQSSRKKPRFVLLENVAFALDLHTGHAVSSVIESLEDLGYSWAYRILDTQLFGLPQRRRRLFILACLEADPATILLDGLNEDAFRPVANPELVGFYWTEGNKGLGWSPEAVPPLKGGSGVGIPSPPGVWDRRTGDFITPGITDAERLQGFQPGWTSPACQIDRGERRRWVLVGNAVSIPIVEWIGRRLGLAREEAGRHERIPDSPGLPRAAAGGPRSLRKAYIARREGPSLLSRSSLAAFGLQNPAHLSVRAISGFTRRYETSPLRLNSEFLDALRDWPRRVADDAENCAT
ncbi:MAG TPA: DNA (cytosine-5-)-methyltransferase [Lichenihabitans sp.]|jgi:DNA (cytosine-5)-methyltransferase 1|nr:DNA (cytosine-5-)-methyltransferase [Lichenihabitans sp.]